MKRLLAVLCFSVLLVTAPAAAAYRAEETAGHHGEEGGDPLLPWKIANFVLLAGGLGYLIYRKAGGFYTARDAQVRGGLEESARLKREAEARYAEVDQRLANIGAEIEALRGAAQRESAAEGDRIRAGIARDIAKIQAQANQDIESAAKAARYELRGYAAELAVGLAERKIRERLTPDSDNALLQAMLKDLDRQAAGQNQRAS